MSLATVRRWAIALLLPAALAGPFPAVSAQEVVLEGAGDVALDRRLSRLLQANPLVVASNTTIAEGDTIRRSVLVLDASLIHEGVILGDLVLVDAGAFVRPGAVVTGDLVNIAGGLYRSEIADIRGLIIDLPFAPYHVVREPDRLVIRAADAPSRLVLDGVLGVHAPTYDRVNGLTLVWGAAYRLPMVAGVQPLAHGQVGWQTQRGEPTYAVDLTLQRSATALAVGHERAWDTNEQWIRGDLVNSLLYLWDGQDLRDYHEVERSWIEVSRGFADRARRFSATATVRGQIEDARSLAAGQPWFILGSETRANPAVDDGRATSLIGGLDVAWQGGQTRFEGRAELESARGWWDGDFRFDRATARGEWAMLGFANHTLAIDFFLQTPLGNRPLPRQRWSFVGGPATLHTLPVAEHSGDHVVFVESNYIIPTPDRLALPVLGAPRVHLIHAAGMAWTAGDRRDLHQEVGVQLDFFGVYVRYSVVPDDPGISNLSVGLSWPFGRAYPWE